MHAGGHNREDWGVAWADVVLVAGLEHSSVC
jgi:hypothetical protein